MRRSDAKPWHPVANLSPFVARAVAALALVVAACAPMHVPQPFAAPPAEIGARARLVVVGDLQRTSLIEAWREQNDAERARVVAQIAAERPDLVAITGDLVFDGRSGSKWEAFDALAAPIRAAGVPAIAAFGNHEYWGGRYGERGLFARFPHMDERHWYAVPFGPLRIVVLDSNVAELDDDEWDTQRAWYEGTLSAFDVDDGVRGVLVMMHHPPYTNSTVTGDEAHVQEAFVPAFARAKKTLAMLCGHVHSYERFERGGKTFVVSGGGGGPRALLATGDARRHTDDRFAGPALRDFNYTVYTLGERGVDAEVKGLPKGGDTFRSMDRFTLRWP